MNKPWEVNMSEKDVLRLLDEFKAVMSGHFVYVSTKHGPLYINKDALYPHVNAAISRICKEMASRFLDVDIDVVIGPEKGGIILATWVAYWLTQMKEEEVLAVYAERDEQSVFKPKEATTISLPGASNIEVKAGEELILRHTGFVIKRGQDQLIKGRKVLVVEDIVNMGETVKKVVALEEPYQFQVVGVAAICNRGGVTMEDLDVRRFRSLVNVTFEAHAEADCPQCAKGEPVSTNVGKGQAFLDRKKG